MQYAVFLVNCTSAWYVHKTFFFIFRLMTYTDFCSVGRSVSIPQLNETVKQNIREIDRHDRRYMYIPSFAFPIDNTCPAKPYFCYLYRGSVPYRSTVDYVCSLLLCLTTNNTTTTYVGVLL